jgi:hypothetical protein
MKTLGKYMWKVQTNEVAKNDQGRELINIVIGANRLIIQI